MGDVENPLIGMSRKASFFNLSFFLRRLALGVFWAATVKGEKAVLPVTLVAIGAILFCRVLDEANVFLRW